MAVSSLILGAVSISVALPVVSTTQLALVRTHIRNTIFPLPVTAGEVYAPGLNISFEVLVRHSIILDFLTLLVLQHTAVPLFLSPGH